MRIFTRRLLLLACIVVCIPSARAYKPADGFEKENNSIKQDITNIKSDKDRIAYWQLKLERDLKFNRELVANASRKELAKVKSDLKRDLDYLVTDYAYLKKRYRLALQQQRLQLKDRVATIKSLNKKIKAAAKKENNSAVKYYTALRDVRANEIDNYEIELDNLEMEQLDNLVMVAELIKETANYIGDAANYITVNPDSTAELDR